MREKTTYIVEDLFWVSVSSYFFEVPNFIHSCLVQDLTKSIVMFLLVYMWLTQLF